jgi:hypothetical protein
MSNRRKLLTRHAQRHSFSMGQKESILNYAMQGMSEVYGHIHEDVALRQRLVREVGLGLGLGLPIATQELVKRETHPICMEIVRTSS